MKYQTNDRIAQLEDEVRSLKAQLKHEQETKNGLFTALNNEARIRKIGDDVRNGSGNSIDVNELIQALNKMPDGTLYRMVKDIRTGALSIHYASGMWENILGISIEDSITDIGNIFSHVEKNDLNRLIQTIDESFESLNNFRIELRYHHPEKKNEYWIQISAYPHREGNFIYADGFIFDITLRKTGEQNLNTEKDRLQELNAELQATNEELAATNEEFSVTTEELHRMNDLLSNEINTRIEVMKKLEDSEATLSNFINQSFEGIIIMDNQGAVIEWNNIMTQLSGLTREEALGKYEWDLLKMRLSDKDYPPEAFEKLVQSRLQYIGNGRNQKPVTEEIIFQRPDGTKSYLQTSMFPIGLAETCLFGRVVHDITEKKKTDMELDRYRTQLESMVESKTRELTISQNNLLSLSHRQALFIEVLQILQLEENVPKAMDMALAAIGKYTNVSRMQTWENNPDGVTYGCTYEWCNEGVEPAIQYLRVLPLEFGKPWFDMLAADNIICTSDIYTLPTAIQGILEQQAVKSIVVLPLSHYGVHFGFISFTVCETREWSPEDVDLLGSIAQIVATVVRRYQIEKTVQVSQQTMQTVLDNISSNIFVTDFDSKKILFANKAFKDAAGQDVDGIECHKMLQAGRETPCEYCPQALLRDKNHYPTGYIHHWEDCNEITGRWYSIASTAIKWVDGQTAIMELATDITDRKQVEIELIRAKEKAEESDKLKSSFLANMSHEIRTPVNGITGFLHLLNSDNLSSQRRREYINIINNSSVQLVKLIDDIIDIAKIEAKQMDIHPAPVQINSLMDELHLYFETYMQTNNKGHISLVLDDSQFVDNLVISVDLTRLRQVITNLINNAIKFTEKGYIRFGYRQLSPCKLEFAVEDTGIGLNPEHKDVIFERFRQVELTNSRLYGGTGLGLSISRSLVQMMGGDLWVESVEGEGSTFYFTITTCS